MQFPSDIVRRIIERKRNAFPPVLLLFLLAFASGCSVEKFAINKLGDALASGGTTFGRDDDPELVKAAVPFSLKLIESLLAESPRHSGLLLAAASGFTQYAYAFVQEDADELAERDLAAATALRARARKLYARARNYGLRGLEVRHAGFEKMLRANPSATVLLATKADVPLLYWAAAAWGAEISLSKDNPDAIADQPVVETLIDRAVELDESFDHGALHSFLINYELARPGKSGDAAQRARKHFERAVELTKGQSAGPLVSFAEAVCVKQQDVKEFKALLDRALAVDVNARPEWRLVNTVMQRRARWLLSRTDDLFLPAEPPPAKAN